MRKGSGEKMAVPQGTETESTRPRHAVGPKEGPKEAVQGLGLGPQAGATGWGWQSP